METVEISYEELLRAASGTDEDGYPRAFASLALNTVSENGEDMIPGMSTAFGGAVLHVFAAGGCAVIQADFPARNQFEYSRAVAVAEEWMDHLEENKIISCVVVPMDLYGQIYLLFTNLVYFTGYRISEDSWRLVLCFDNSQPCAFETDEIDIRSIHASVEGELSRREAELENEYMAIREETRRAQNPNPYDEAFRNALNDIEFTKEQEEEIREEGVRIVKEED